MTRNAPELSVVMPVYNERELIATVIQEWTTALEALRLDYELLVYDDGSTDDTLAILREISATLPRTEVRHHANRGHGPTILRGFAEARGEWILQVDSDGEIPAEAFATLWRRREEHDLLLGSRENRRSEPSRRIVSMVSALSVRLLFGPGVRDVNSPFRLFRGESLRRLLAPLPPDLFAPNVALSGLAVRAGLRILEVGVPHHGRKGGTTSLSRAKLLRAAARSLRETIRVARSARTVERPG